GLELVHFSEAGNHAEVEDRALARGQGRNAPGLAPAILCDDALEVAVEVVGIRGLAVDIVVAERIAADGHPAIVGLLVHDHLSPGLRCMLRSPASKASTAGGENGLANMVA